MKPILFKTVNPVKLITIATIVSLLPMSSFAKESEVITEGDNFFTGSTLSGGLYLMGRNRDRLDVDTTGAEWDSTWNDNLTHISTLASVGLKSRDYGDLFGYELAGYAVMDMFNGEPSGANLENEFSFAGEKWSENWEDGKPRNAVSIYRAMAHLAFPFGLTVSGGMGQIGVEGVIGNNWSYFPGSYTGGQAEMNFADKVTIKYAMVNKYKAPWFQRIKGFSTKNAWDSDAFDSENKIDYLHGASIKVTVNDNLNLTASVGNSEGYLMSYFGKISSSFDVASGFNASYQIYMSDTYDEWDSEGYDGIAYFQALTTGLSANLWSFNLEGTYARVEGAQGNYLPRLTRGYGNSQGGFQVWWDLRSDWNENGEKAVYANVSRKLDDLLGVDGWKFGVGGAYGWGAEYEPNNVKDGVEYAWKVDLSFTTDLGRFKGSTFAVHYMQYTNDQSELGNWKFPNMFNSEKDFMVKAILPFGMNL